ncbi:MAG: ATP-binding protein [Bacteroidota bacterium]|nr:ATP-binding protein [Bacteroidota bacterium]
MIILNFLKLLSTPIDANVLSVPIGTVFLELIMLDLISNLHNARYEWPSNTYHHLNPHIDRKLFENTFYNIYVTDNRVGFDSKYVEEILVVFKRLHTYHEFEGTGIGLSICKKIVEKHKGFITA